MKRLLFIGLLIAVGWKLTQPTGSITLGPGIMADHPPLQQNVMGLQTFTWGDYEIMPAARFNLRARVLGRKRYTWGREADLSPIDLALGWGPMSDENVLRHIKISQGNRFYRWRVNEYPIPRREIETHSANMHMIPATAAIGDRIKAARPGDIIALSGHLVNVSAKDGWGWRSSLTRQDTGRGACELIWVEAFDVVTGSISNP